MTEKRSAVAQLPTPSQQTDTQAAIIDALLAASRALVGLAARSLASVDADVTLPQFRALVVLATRGPQRVVDISGELGISSSTGTRLCERLVRKGWVRRSRSPSDRRAVRLGLTPLGRHLVDQVTERRRAELARVVAAIPQIWHSALTQALSAFVTASGEMPEEQWWLGWAGPGDADQ